MRHCFEFDAYDVWYLKDNEEFTDRVLYIGDCPRCKKHVCVLKQTNKNTGEVLTVKKVGDAALVFSKSNSKEILFTRNRVNKMSLNPKPYGWRYGVNKEKSDKYGNKTIEQYAVDFYGNSELIKKNDLNTK